MLKDEARKLYKQKRAALTGPEKMKLDDLLLIQFQTLQLPFFNTVLSFYPIEEKNEIDTFIITDYLQFINPGLTVAYPKTDIEQQTMEAISCTKETRFEINKYGIPEPVNGEPVEPLLLDVVLVPLLAFDKHGNRVGYGKGFYDKFLEQCGNGCLKIGLSYFEPAASIEDAGKFDVPLNACITPQKVYVF